MTTLSLFELISNSERLNDVTEADASKLRSTIPLHGAFAERFTCSRSRSC
jgi:hypothetical protein